MKTIKSYLPIFQGFYGTHFSCECDSDVCEDEGVLYEEIRFDYTDYNKRVAEKCVCSVWNFLKLEGYSINIEFEDIYSPRFYNFENDSINCTYSVNEEDFTELVDYLQIHLEAFRVFLKDKYSSYEGFVSFFSTDPQDWFGEYLNEDSDKFERAFVGMLEFMLENEGYTVDTMVEDASEQIGYINYELVGKFIK